MAGKKFSEFTTSAMGAATSFLVGYDTVADTNDRWDRTAVAGWLSPAINTIYSGDGTIDEARVVTMGSGDTLTFNNNAGQNLLVIDDGGEVCIGQIANANGNTTVAVGLNAVATGGSTTAVGSYASANNGNSTAYGHNAKANVVGGLSIGYYSKLTGTESVAIGYACGPDNGTAVNTINIGNRARGEAANSITFASNGAITAPTTANAFGVYMTSDTNADFEVIGSGESTLRTDLTVTGQVAFPKRKFAITSSTDGDADGDVVYFGTGTTVLGQLYYYKSTGAWTIADANVAASADAAGLLGVALGTTPGTHGMVIRGMVTLDHDPGAVGDILYISTTAGQITGTVPNTSGDTVRIVGYCLDASDGQIWFNPSSEYILLA